MSEDTLVERMKQSEKDAIDLITSLKRQAANMREGGWAETAQMIDREVGIIVALVDVLTAQAEEIERLKAALKGERERCAGIADEAWRMRADDERPDQRDIAAAIRVSGEPL